jgi:hypothetical protein
MITEKIIKVQQMHCKRCDHIWLYSGSGKFVCTCPRYRTSIMLNPKKKNNSGGLD